MNILIFFDFQGESKILRHLNQQALLVVVNPVHFYRLHLGIAYLRLKVAEHSFRACFANAIKHVYKDFKKQTCRHQSDYFIYSTPAISVLFFSIIESSVLIALNFHYKDMLEKVTMQRTQQFSAFFCYRKNPVKCNACAVARKIETDCFSRNMPISNNPVVRISRNLAKR